MALSVDYIYKYALDLIRKNQAGGLSSLQFESFWNGSQSAYQSDLLGRYQKLTRGGASTGLPQIATIMTKLTPFIKPTSVSIVSGIGSKPGDFLYELAFRIDAEPVIHITHNQYTNLVGSVIDPPSVTEGNYYCVEYGNYYTVFPSVTTTASLDYISTTVDVHWGYTFDLDGRQVYSVGLSTQPQWDDNSCREITERMLKSIGVAYSSKDFENFGQSVIATGA